MHIRDDRESLEAYLFNRHDRETAPAPPASKQPSAGRDLRIRTDDGVTLAATLFPASATASANESESATGGSDRPPPVVVVASATGVLRRYYAPFATWLASVGFTVVTFDYRGMGGSRGEDDAAMRDATMHAWGEHDLAAVVAWAADVAGDGTVSLVGHSVGGQLVGLLPDAAAARVRSLVTVAAQSGDYRLWPMPMRLAMAALWYGVVPSVTHAVGYLPGSLGVGEDLPAGVALEWARWCRTPGYLVTEIAAARGGFARIQAPMLAFGFDDDPYAPPAAVEALLGLYTSADIRRRQLGRHEGRFGHFGFFRSRHRALWREIATHLAESIG